MPEKEKDQFPPLQIGQRVVVLGKRKGFVRFCGPTAFGPGEWVGIELEKPTGTHDGEANGQRYFTCPMNHGIYVQRHGVHPVNSWQAAAFQIQSFLRGRKDRQGADFKRTFFTWNQMEMQDESEYLNQTATISRVEQMLKAYHPANTPNQSHSAVAMSISAGVSIDPHTWGQEVEVQETYKGPRIEFPVTEKNVREVLNHIRTRPHEPIHPKFVMQLIGSSIELFNKVLKDSVFDMDRPLL
ncbi:hypothetical protein GUITHDRAFT_154854, partial [Guillardia theta CCMP2712]